ncbi:MAG: FAD-dependent oxidoreductase [Saprospiraceae bacterium]
MTAHQYDFLIIGGGIFGLSAAIELANRQHTVGLLNPDSIPHHLAASTDISKIIRMDYGSDEEYFRMAEAAIAGWEKWNDTLGESLYHETGFLLLCKEPLESGRQAFEYQSYRMLRSKGYTPERWDARQLQQQMPVIDTATYPEAVYSKRAGFAESGLVLEKLASYARSLGVGIHEHQTAVTLLKESGKVTGIKTREGAVFHAGQVIVAAGAHTPFLLPELSPYIRITGHPVFWLKPANPQPYTYPHLGVFAADISNSGWYGFPLHPKHGVVKVARHADGLIIHPDEDDRQVQPEEIADMRAMLRQTLPDLATAPLVYTRRCLYTDTLDGHFWIDRHPEIGNLCVATGGSGHAFKMGPVLGPMIADVAEGKQHQWSDRYKWRHLDRDTQQQEEARRKG